MAPHGCDDGSTKGVPPQLSTEALELVARELSVTAAQCHHFFVGH